MNQHVNTTVLRPGYRILYKNHGNNQIGYWEGWVEQPGTVKLCYARVLGGKATEREYATEGKNIGRSNETTPMQQAHAELESRTNKQLDKGYVWTQREATAPSTNSLGLLKPMLATPLEKVKPEKITWDQAFVQPKLDGHRALYVDGTLYSRQGKALNLPHIVKAIEDSGLGHLHLDGEIYTHGRTLQELSSLIKRHQEGTETLEYHIYDHVEAAPFAKRIMRLVSHFSLSSRIHPRLKPVHTVPVKTMETVMELHQDCRKAGYEGTMLRFGNEHYRDGKRSRTLLKIKEFQDAEFEVVGVEEGKPYTRGDRVYQLPIWECDAGNGETFTVTCQGDLNERDTFWHAREQYIGRLLTVKFHYMSKDGIPQLPVALRFRDDI